MPKKAIVSFVLDETGSMLSVKDQTISGFNEYVETLRSGEHAKSVRFTLTKFNSAKTEIAHNNAKLANVEPLTKESYRPASQTPLYDAIGQTITALDTAVDGKKRKVLVVIQTDGQENASKEYDSDDIFDMIKKREKKGWTFVFLGADQDAWLAGQKMGLREGNVISYASADTASTFGRTASATSRHLRDSGSSDRGFWEED
jgi:hypothetical protein